MKPRPAVMGAPPGTRTPNPLIERHICYGSRLSASVLVSGGVFDFRSWTVAVHLVSCSGVSVDQDDRWIMPGPGLVAVRRCCVGARVRPSSPDQGGACAGVVAAASTARGVRPDGRSPRGARLHRSRA